MPINVRELRERQARIVTEGRERLEQITDSTPDARAAELREQHDAALAEYDRIQGQIDAHEAVEERGRRLASVDTGRRPGDDGEGAEERAAELDEREVFRRMVQFGAHGLTPEERSFAGRFARVSPEMANNAEFRAQTITTSGGGYLIPQGFQPEIVRSMADWGPMTDESVVRVLRTATGNQIPWPTVDDTGNTGVDHAINTADADQDVTFGQKMLDAYVASSGMVKVPYELLQDSAFDITSLLNELFGERLGRRMNTKLTTGTGSSQANGIVTASTLGKTAASATAIASDELFDLIHSVNPAYRRSAKCGFQFNDQTLKALRKLKDGQGNYLWQMGDVRTGAPPTLLEKPYHVNQAMADIATGAKTILFGDLSKYVTRIVQDFTMLVLRERFADAFQVGFIAFARYDGELVDTAAVKHLIQG